MPRRATGRCQLPEEPHPGVFIRGDDALYRYAPALRTILYGGGRVDALAATAILRELENVLRSCEGRGAETAPTSKTRGV